MNACIYFALVAFNPGWSIKFYKVKKDALFIIIFM